MNDIASQLDLLWPAFVAGLIVLATHVPLGIQVLARGIIFIDLAVAQVAGLGRWRRIWPGTATTPGSSRARLSLRRWARRCCCNGASGAGRSCRRR